MESSQHRKGFAVLTVTWRTHFCSSSCVSSPFPLGSSGTIALSSVGLSWGLTYNILFSPQELGPGGSWSLGQFLLVWTLGQRVTGALSHRVGDIQPHQPLVRLVPPAFGWSQKALRLVHGAVCERCSACVGFQAQGIIRGVPCC